MKFKLMNTN